MRKTPTSDCHEDWPVVTVRLPWAIELAGTGATTRIPDIDAK
jgi:hypothetical protein